MSNDSEIDAIVRKSRSNLAITLICLPKAARGDMRLFYAFCRIVDDIADEPGMSLEQRKTELGRWTDIVHGRAQNLTSIEQGIRDLMDRRGIPADEMQGIIDGVAMDLESRVYETWEDLKHYCYGVASCVGLVSTRIFGCTQEKSREYAIQLGYALQLTNIMRDVGEDLRDKNRVYLPQEDLRKHGVTMEDLLAGNRTKGFVSMMQEQAARAKTLYAAALANLTRQDKSKLLAAETMRKVYRHLLALMEAEGFRVFEKRHRVSKPQKLWILFKAIVRRYLPGI